MASFASGAGPAVPNGYSWFPPEPTTNSRMPVDAGLPAQSIFANRW